MAQQLEGFLMGQQSCCTFSKQTNENANNIGGPGKTLIPLYLNFTLPHSSES